MAPRSIQLLAPPTGRDASTTASSSTETATIGNDQVRNILVETLDANKKPHMPMTANIAWFSKVANGAPLLARKEAIEDADNTIKRPKPSSRKKIATIRCHDVMGRSSQSFAVRRITE